MTDTDFIEIAFKLWRETQLEADKPKEPSCHLYAAVAGAPAANWRDVAFKLAFWRWSGECLETESSEISPRDRLIYSAFRDAVRLTGTRELATDADRETEFFADLLTAAKVA